MNLNPALRPLHRITLAGKGNEAPGCGAGDLVLVVRQALHARFERCGNDLLATAQVLLKNHSSVKTYLTREVTLVHH